MIANERQLAAVAYALIGSNVRLPKAERSLINRSEPKPSTKLLSTLRKEIREGADPLGDAFARIRSPESRREQGATYTPSAIVDAMIAWAKDEACAPVRIVDPGVGSGRFILAASKAFPKARLVGVDIDPLATLMLRANAAVLKISSRLSIELVDYRSLELPVVNGPTLFIGNPPYVRHHDISPSWKAWFGDTAAKLGFTASSLAGLHVHFFLRTRQIARPGDFGAFITAAEWMDVNYGSVLRKMLADGLGGTAVHIIDPKAQPFADALSTGAITCFRVGRRPDSLTLRNVANLADLAPLNHGREVPWDAIASASKWSHFTRESAPLRSDEIELGELFRVHRGQVTGCNEVWIEHPGAPVLPERFLLPAVTRARELLEAGYVLDDASALRRVVDLPADLEQLSSAERKAVERFLIWARQLKAHDSYIAQHRSPWWCVRYREPAPVLCTYMARRPPHFVVNAAEARHLNIAHGLYPREKLSTEVLERLVRALGRTITGEGGRVYAGGLIKFEPRELERIRIPRLEMLDAVDLSDQVDTRSIPRRRSSGNGRISA